MVVKTRLTLLTGFGVGSFGRAPFTETTDLTGEITPAGDTSLYLQIQAQDEGRNTNLPGRVFGGYRYDPSMILNADGSIDLWSAANGTYNLCFVFKSDAKAPARLEDFCFEQIRP